MRRAGTRVDRDKEDTGYGDYSTIPVEKCRNGVEAFDAYCHGDNKPWKYADYRNGDDGSCAYDHTNSQIHCLAQQCMFEYCLWRRDQYLDTCSGFEDAWTAAAEDNCEFERNGKCLRLETAVEFDKTEARSAEYSVYMKAKN